MAFEVLDEHEQGELVQKWLRENVLTILIGVGLGLVLIFGWQQWRSHQAQHRLDAATQYDVLSSNMTKKDYDAAKQIGEKIKSDYPDTPYAVLSAMAQADIAALRADPETVHAQLQWAYDHAGIDALKTLAGMRLASSDIARNKAQDALDLLDKLPASGYSAMSQELRGDALAALGRKDEARAAYTDALTHLDVGAANRSFVEMKLNDLSVEKKSS